MKDLAYTRIVIILFQMLVSCDLCRPFPSNLAVVRNSRLAALAALAAACNGIVAAVLGCRDRPGESESGNVPSPVRALPLCPEPLVHRGLEHIAEASEAETSWLTLVADDFVGEMQRGKRKVSNFNWNSLAAKHAGAIPETRLKRGVRALAEFMQQTQINTLENFLVYTKAMSASGTVVPRAFVQYISHDETPAVIVGKYPDQESHCHRGKMH
eukprot:3436531-Amphidinium_carterae.1